MFKIISRKNIIESIIKNNISLFGSNPTIEKINVGFTNTLYKVNDSYIVKVCTNKDNENDFKLLRTFEDNKIFICHREEGAKRYVFSAFSSLDELLSEIIPSSM